VRHDRDNTKEQTISDVYIPHAIPLTELAKVIGRKVAEVEAECAEFGHFVGVDWRGQPAVSEDDAHRIVTGSARRVREDEVAWATHLAECEQWTIRRDQLVRESQADAEIAAQRAGRGGGDAAQAGVEAGRSAGADYEAATPLPLWRGEEDGNARRLYSDSGRPRLLDRARDLLAGAPR